jgi:AAA family ATP:ADP antiporter
MSLVAGMAVAGLHWVVRRDEDSSAPPAAGKSAGVQDKKPTLSFAESLRVLSADKYLRNIAVMVISYGLSIEFTEIIWKAAVKKAYPGKSDYLRFMGRYSAMVGMGSFVMTFVGSGIVNRLGWRAGALMTPGIMGLLGIPFFASICFGGLNTPRGLSLAVTVGMVQNVLSKATKYAIFDPTKEMTYIPLDRDSKTKGKSAIDVLGARLGKSGGALSQQVLVVMFGSIVTGAPVVAIMFALGIMVWINAVNSLAPLFKERSENMEGKRSK